MHSTSVRPARAAPRQHIDEVDLNISQASKVKTIWASLAPLIFTLRIYQHTANSSETRLVVPQPNALLS